MLSLLSLWRVENVIPFSAVSSAVVWSRVIGRYCCAFAWVPASVASSRNSGRKAAAALLCRAGYRAGARRAYRVWWRKTFCRWLFERYALFWHIIALAAFATLAIYFALVFFSALFTLSSTDLVERKSAEVQSLARLTRFSSDILSSELLLDLPKLAEQITALAAEATESDCAWLELRSNSVQGRSAVSAEDSEEIIHSYSNIGQAAAERIMEEGEGFAEEENTNRSPRGELEQSRKPFVLRRRIRAQQYLFPSPEQAGANKELHSMVAVPLLRNGEVRGGLYVAKHREDGFDDDDLTVLTAFSDVASLALETARLVQDSVEKQKFDGELRAARIMQKSLLPERFPDVPGFEVYAISIPAYDVGGDYYDFSTLWTVRP